MDATTRFTKGVEMNEKILNSRKTDDETLPAGVFFDRSRGLYSGSDVESHIVALELNANEMLSRVNSTIESLEKTERSRRGFIAS